MAKQIEDIVVRLGLEKFEGLDKIRSSFRDLSKVTNLSERDINSARTSLFEFAKAAGNTEAVNKGLASALQGLRTQVDTCGRAYAQLTKDLNRLNEVSRGSTDALERQRQALLNNANAGRQNVDSLQRQIDSLKQLQRETRPGSSAFIQLGKDIDNVTVKLGKLKSEAQGFNLALNQQAGATPSVLNNQIAILQRGLQTVRYDAEKFVDTLRQIQLLQITQSGRTGRSGVIAAYEAFQSPAYMGGFADPSRLSAMPDTTAALNQELAELSERLLNTARGSSTYTDVAIRMAEVQRQLRTDVMGTSEAFRQLSIAEAGAERRAGKLADIQSYYATQGPLAPGVGGYRDPNTGAMIAAGAYTPGRIRVDEAAYARPIGPQPFPEAAKQALQSVESAQRSVTDIYERAFIQRTELQAKYNQIYIDKALEGLELEGQLRKKEFDTQLADFDRRMGIADKRRGRRLSGMQLAQGVGAALSGGIFGGPEGLIGGLGGLALGGVGGAFAGAAAGAQVGMFRQQLGGVTDYSARIDKLQIALRGIVGSQDAYSQALSAAASVTRDLNIPQEVAIQGMTRLSAAVKGAGGTVSDSAFAFRAVSEAVKATGGNAEQADGALLALTQVFSKGKVSAEELNQIAERLPGTFTLFAKAAGMTGPQLQKALQEGQVGLNDLMKFLQLISTEYGKTALKIAASSQEAGARLSVAMQDMQLAVGRALQPVGALLQDAFAEFIRSTTPALILAAKLIGGGITNMYNAFASGINILVSLRGVFENLAKTMLVFGGITAGVFVASNITTFTNALKGALAVLRTLLSVEKALLVIENARIAAQAILAGLTTGATKGKILGAILGGAAGVGAVIGIGKLVEGVIGDIEKGLSGALKGLDLKLPTLSKFPTPSAGSDKAAKDAEKERKKAAEEALRQQTSLNRLLQEQLRLNYEAGAVDADALSKLDAEATLLKLITRLKIDEVTLSAKTTQEREQGIINLTAEFTAENKRIKKQRREILEEIAGLGDDIKKEWRELTGVFIDESPIDAGIRKFEEARTDFIERRDKEMKQLREKAGLRPEGAAKLGQIGGAKAAAEAITPGQIRAVVSKQILQDDIAALQADIRALESGANTMGTLGEIMERHRKYWQDLDEGQRQYIANLAEIKDSLRFMQDARIGVGLKEGAQAYVESIGTMREATAQLAQTGIKGVEDAIFSLVTTGTANFREFAASILKDTARMIIQQLILRSVMQVIGAIGGGGAPALSPLSNFNAGAAQYAPLANAMGNAYAANGIVPFAMGGVVNQPTLFKFANGGAGRLGLMGEAGPEAIMPLRRLPNGRLGVEQAGGGAPVTVNVSVDASGTSVQGNAGQGEQLGRVISQAVQAELVRQQRPGGLLSR
jgi:lambda family phage tail tape measure protein